MIVGESMSNARILFAAPQSGGGKTTVTCAVLKALQNRRLDPQAFKCGPDYIDPMFHSEVVGTPSRNLDLFFLGSEGVRTLLKEKSTGGISVIEGVMGYYDGVAMNTDASAYDVARTTETPAVLIVDARAVANSLAATVKGFAEYRADSGLRGVILNRSSAGMYTALKTVIESETGLSVYGYLPELPDCAFESRHLGLITAQEIDDLRGIIRRLAEAAEEFIDLDGLIELARSAPELTAEPLALPEPVEGAPVIAVARDKAFCFYYADSLELLERLGARIEYFSPMEDTSLPEGTAGLYLGGGYPEVYAGVLSRNTAMLAAIRGAIEGGMPTIAECGGFMYLHRVLEGDDGVDYPMAAVFDARAYRTPRLGRFGYITLTAKEPSVLGGEGLTLPAHEFHYWDSEEPGSSFAAQKPMSTRGWEAARVSESMYAGFPHLYLRANPDAARSFLRRAQN